MAIQSRMSADDQTLVITVDGRFDFSSHQEFREAYEHYEGRVQQYVIDMQATSYLDSSALGMLLLLRDYAGGDTANIVIRHCNEDVKKILAIANFDQLFTIE